MNEICGLHLPERMQVYIENLAIFEMKNGRCYEW